MQRDFHDLLSDMKELLEDIKKASESPIVSTQGKIAFLSCAQELEELLKPYISKTESSNPAH